MTIYLKNAILFYFVSVVKQREIKLTFCFILFCFLAKLKNTASPRAEFPPLQFLINNEKAIRHNYYTHNTRSKPQSESF